MVWGVGFVLAAIYLSSIQSLPDVKVREPIPACLRSTKKQHQSVSERLVCFMYAWCVRKGTVWNCDLRHVRMLAHLSTVKVVIGRNLCLSSTTVCCSVTVFQSLLENGKTKYWWLWVKSLTWSTGCFKATAVLLTGRHTHSGASSSSKDADWFNHGVFCHKWIAWSPARWICKITSSCDQANPAASVTESLCQPASNTAYSM